jgi:hypothetical protein
MYAGLSDFRDMGSSDWLKTAAQFIAGAISGAMQKRIAICALRRCLV